MPRTSPSKKAPNPLSPSMTSTPPTFSPAPRGFNASSRISIHNQSVTHVVPAYSKKLKNHLHLTSLCRILVVSNDYLKTNPFLIQKIIPYEAESRAPGSCHW